MRIESLVPLINDGTLIFDSDKIASDMDYALGYDMLSTYMGDGTDPYDDFPDCLEQVVRICTKSKFRMIAKRNR
jgi:hypothetical protein